VKSRNGPLAVKEARPYLDQMKMLAEITKDALELPPVQRLTLARILLDLSEDNHDFSPDAEAAWEEEICRRMEAVKAGTASSRTFDEVFTDLDRLHPS
jgi:hypothetical protein